MKLRFFLNFEPNPPSVTHQEKSVRVVRGKPVFYMPQRLADARTQFAAKLKQFAPAKPFTSPFRLDVTWMFTPPKALKDAHFPRWKDTKPDLDNLQKMLQDVMTECGFWKDDALVCLMTIAKIYCAPGERHGVLIGIDDDFCKNGGGR